MTSKPSSTATAIPNDAAGIEAIAKMAVAARSTQFAEIDTAALADPSVPGKVIAAVTPDGRFQDVSSLLAAYRLTPRRAKGSAKAATLQSFVDLVNRHKTDQSAVFAQTKMPSPALKAVINYHQASSKPGWSDHQIVYEFPLTEEFTAWLKADGEVMSQGEFAQFLEDRAAELASPLQAEVTEYERLFREKVAAPSEIIKLARDLEIKVESYVKQGTRLQSGERTVMFSENHQTATGEQVIIPGVFIVSVAAFDGGDPIRIPARLRYRVKEGRVMWAYQLYRANHWLQVEVRNAMDTAQRDTGLPAFEGAPEA